MQRVFLILRAGARTRKGTPTPLQDRSAGSYVLAMNPFRLAVCALPLAVLPAACDSNQPGPDPGPGRIIFTRVGNGLVDIYGMDVNGHNLQRLTTSFAFD